MANDMEKETENMSEDMIVEMTSEYGDTFYCREEMIVPVNGEKFALLVPVELDDEGYVVEPDEEDDDEAFFAKIVVDEDGEENYVEPTEEEFDAVVKAYNELDLGEE